MKKLGEITLINHGLRDYQIEAKKKIYESWKDGNRSVLLQMPTGTGKTRLFCSIVREFNNLAITRDFPTSILIVAHREELINQINQDLSNKYHIDGGIIKAGHPFEPNKPTQIASIQTLNNRQFNKDVSLIIIDEAHHAVAASYRSLWESFPNAVILGVTATPYRLNGTGLNDLFNDLIIVPPINEFIRTGYLSNIRYYAVPDAKLPDLSMVKTVAGDYDIGELMNTIGNNTIIQSKLIESYKKYVNGKKGIVYTINRQHNEIVKEAYNQAGIKAEIVDSNTPPITRARIVEEFKANKIKVLCNVDIFTEGFDCPDIDFVQLARPSKSLTKYLQQIGRCMRPATNKSHGYVLDNVGMYKENGLFNSEWNWETFFYGDAIIENGISNQADSKEVKIEFEIGEGDDELLLINTDIEIQPTLNEELSLFDFYSELLKGRFTILINLGYSQDLVYNALKLLHPEDHLESEDIYLKYMILIEALTQCSSEVFAKEQKISELENSVLELKEKSNKINFVDMLKGYPKVKITYDALINVFQEDEVITDLLKLFPVEIKEANKEYERISAQDFENEKEIAANAIAEKKNELQNLTDRESKLRHGLNEFIQNYISSDIKESPKELVIKRISPAIFDIDDAYRKLKDEIVNLRIFSINRNHDNMNSRTIYQFGIIERKLKMNQIISEDEKINLIKLIRDQIDKGFSVKHSDIIMLLARNWNQNITPQVITQNGTKIVLPEPTALVLNSFCSESIGYKTFVKNLKNEIHTLYESGKINKQTHINTITLFLSCDVPEQIIIDKILVILNEGVNSGYKLTKLKDSYSYILENRITDEKIFHLLIEIYLLKKGAAVYKYQIKKDLSKFHKISYNDILPILNSDVSQFKSHINSPGFFSHKSLGVVAPNCLVLNDNVGRRIEKKFTLTEYLKNKEGAIQNILGEFPQYKSIQIEYLFESVFGLL